MAFLAAMEIPISLWKERTRASQSENGQELPQSKS